MIQERKIRSSLVTKNILYNKKNQSFTIFFLNINPLKIGKKLCEITLERPAEWKLKIYKWSSLDCHQPTHIWQGVKTCNRGSTTMQNRSPPSLSTYIQHKYLDLTILGKVSAAGYQKTAVYHCKCTANYILFLQETFFIPPANICYCPCYEAGYWRHLVQIQYSVPHYFQQYEYYSYVVLGLSRQLLYNISSLKT